MRVVAVRLYLVRHRELKRHLRPVAEPCIKQKGWWPLRRRAHQKVSISPLRELMVPETTVPGTVTFCGSLCGPESSMPPTARI